MTDPLVRNYATEAVEFDSTRRVLEGRFVPYGEVARVADRTDAGDLDVYREGFRPQAFRRQTNTTEPGVLRRIGMVHAHDGGLGFLGSVRELRETDDGLHGAVSILRSRAEDVEDLLGEGVDGLSIEFLPRRNGTHVEDGIRWRTDAHLLRVALEAKGAYAGAKVMAFRGTPEGVVLEDYDDAEEIAAAAQRVAELDEWLSEATARQTELTARLTEQR